MISIIKSKIISHSIIMKKNEIYNIVKKMVIDLGGNLKIVKSKYKSLNKQYWKKQLKINKKKIKTRNSNYNRALKLSEDLKEGFSSNIKKSSSKGTSVELWRKEIRRIRARRSRITKNILKTSSMNSIQKILDKMKTENLRLTKKEATLFYNQIVKSGKYIADLSFINTNSASIGLQNEKHFYINDTTREFLLTLFQEGFQSTISGESYGSDVLEDIDLESIESLLIREAPVYKIIENKNASFFAYINTTNLDLSEYQIYNQEQANVVEDREHCLIQSLLNCGIEEAVVNSVKLAISSNSYTPKKDIIKVANIIKRKITLRFFNRDCSKIKITSYGEGDEIEICIYKNHYFQFKNNTKYSKFFISNYEELKDVKLCENIIRKSNNGKYFNYSDTAKINSLRMIHNLFKQGYFKQLDMSNFAESSSSKLLKDQIFLENIDLEQELIDEVKEEEEEVKEEIKIYFADTENFTGNKYHNLYLLGFVEMNNDYVRILNVCDECYSKYGTRKEKEQQVLYTFLNSITKTGKRDAQVYFHNLKYDINIIERHLNVKDICKKDGQLYSVDITFKGRTVQFRCSYKLAPIALGNFGEEFDLPFHFRKKDAIAYGYYTKENNNKIISIEEYKKKLPLDQHKLFIKNMKTEESYNKNKKTFNPTSYYLDYLKLDCLVLKKGLIKFNDLIMNVTRNEKLKEEKGIDNAMKIWDSLTISSLTDKFLLKEGCYNGVYKMKGNLRSYCSQAVTGGRVNVNTIYQKAIILKKLADLDGVSLYPSSESRICQEMGLPKGKAKRFSVDDLKNWEKKHYAIMTVRITEVNKIQQMPFIANKDKDGILQYINERPFKMVEDKNKKGKFIKEYQDVIIDTITLQDYDNFHKIKYEIIDGVYWDEGGNKKMGEIIDKLFEQRLICKKNKQLALSNVLKLMLNSSYGKTIMKKAKTEFKIVKVQSSKKDKETGEWTTTNDEKLWDNYVYNNFNTLKCSRKINKRCREVEQLKVDDSFNRGHIGCLILSMSKRIMNEVFDIANSHSLPIYYTDTDSIHLNYDDVPILEKEFIKKYNRVLTGKKLGQFHIDFNMKDKEGNDRQGKDEEIYATKSVFLAKKCYLDKLESRDEEGNIINDYHYRMKGITKEGILHQAKQYKNGIEGLYEDLAKGTKIEFNLMPYDKDNESQKVLFQYVNGRVNFKKEFTRKVQF